MSAERRDSILEIRDLSLAFRTSRGRMKALRNVSLDVGRKRILGIVGESGCGKSTLISTVMRLLPANAEVTQGQILFDGEDLLQKSEAEMRALRGGRISMVFQDPMTALNPVLPIGRQMVDIQHRDRRSTREKRERAADMLARVGIPDPASRLSDFPHQFSGGMRQRIAIAMALMAEPDLLIADEPTTALDATLEVQIIGLLERLQEDFGCSIIFVTHHLGVVAELCHDVVVMYAGEVAESGSVRDVFHRPAHPYTEMLLRSDPGRIRERTRQLPTIPGEIPSLVELPSGCVFRPRCPKAFARCAEPPPLHEAGHGHHAACHLLAPETVT
jgi:oligopeptide/dipeptide ABC transporter ATP-binding protein